MKEKESGTKYQETKQHGSRLFPFNIYPCTIPLDFPAVPLHWHKEMELIYIKKGKGLIQIETKSFEGEPGDIFVVTPGTLHAIHRIKGYSMEYENTYELGVKAAVLQIIFLLIRMYPSREIVSSPDREQLKEVLQEISVKSSENLSVADMAKFCGWSSSHFMRWFKKMTGDSFTSYVNDRRLAEAAEALRQTDDKILTISQDAGFMNLSNFNRQFKKRYGVTPREYREMIGI